MFETVSKKESKEILKKFKELQKRYFDRETRGDELYYDDQGSVYFSNYHNRCRIYGKVGEYYMYSLQNDVKRPKEVKIVKNLKVKGYPAVSPKGKGVGVSVVVETESIDAVCDRKGRFKKVKGSGTTTTAVTFIPVAKYTEKNMHLIDVDKVLSENDEKIKESLQGTDFSNIDWVLENKENVDVWRCFDTGWHTGKFVRITVKRGYHKYTPEEEARIEESRNGYDENYWDIIGGEDGVDWEQWEYQQKLKEEKLKAQREKEMREYWAKKGTDDVPIASASALLGGDGFVELDKWEAKKAKEKEEKKAQVEKESREYWAKKGTDNVPTVSAEALLKGEGFVELDKWEADKEKAKTTTVKKKSGR